LHAQHHCCAAAAHQYQSSLQQSLVGDQLGKPRAHMLCCSSMVLIMDEVLLANLTPVTWHALLLVLASTGALMFPQL
jgi:hypothetical protein